MLANFFQLANLTLLVNDKLEYRQCTGIPLCKLVCELYKITNLAKGLAISKRYVLVLMLLANVTLAS